MNTIKLHRVKNLNISRPPGIYSRDHLMNRSKLVEVIADECDMNWEIVTDNMGVRKFMHPRYKNKLGKYKLFNIGVKTKFDEDNLVITKMLYPIVEPNLDRYELGFAFSNGVPVSNKFEDFWDTRRGKRYSSYIMYRRYRDMIRNQIEGNTTTARITNDSIDSEFQKYIVERNEKRRIKEEEKEIKEKEKELDMFDGYDSSDMM